MKIAIITYWQSDENYGEALQGFASQRYFRDKGHDAFLIKYVDTPSQEESTPLLRKLISYEHWHFFLKGIFSRFHDAWINRYVQNHLVSRKFEDFKAKNMMMTEQTYSLETLRSCPPEADLLITGSDMVWGGLGSKPAYFLDFGKPVVLRISLAASFGHKLDEVSPKNAGKMKGYLAKFSMISVREDEGMKICKSLGFENVQMCCDPTLLLDRDSYESIAAPIDASREIEAFIYYIGSNEACLTDRKLVETLTEAGIPYSFSCCQGCVNRIPKVFPSIEEWIARIRDSKYVITNSFHGIIFSLVFEKQFVVLSLKEKGLNTRVESILQALGLEDRLCCNVQDLHRILSLSIDYNVVSPKVDMMRQQSRTLLEPYLK